MLKANFYFVLSLCKEYLVIKDVFNFRQSQVELRQHIDGLAEGWYLRSCTASRVATIQGIWMFNFSDRKPQGKYCDFKIERIDLGVSYNILALAANFQCTRLR